MDEYAWGYHGIGIWFGLISMIMFAIIMSIAVKKMGKIKKKIYLTDANAQMIGSLGLFMITSFVIICMDLVSKSDLVTWTFIGIEGISIILFAIALPAKRLTYVVVNPNEFNMYSINNKKLCTIFRNKKIYYVRFKTMEYRYRRSVVVEYIVLSNEPFEYPMVGRFNKRYELSYNMKTQIAMPYNCATKFLFDLNSENWKSVI